LSNASVRVEPIAEGLMNGIAQKGAPASLEGFAGYNKLYARLAEMATDAIVLKDAATRRFIDVNEAAVVMTGFSREELLALEPTDIFPAALAREYTAVMKRWLYDGKGYLHEMAIKTKDGAEVPVDISAVVVEINGKKYVQEIWRDITEQKSLQDAFKSQIRDLEDIVRKRTGELENTIEKLEAAYIKLQNSEQMLVQSAKLISLGEMGAGIAHELNSPIAGVLSISEVLLGRISKDDPNHYLLLKIKDAAVRSKYIILDMLTYARPFKDEYRDIYVNEALRSTMGIFISEIKTSRIEIVEKFDKNLPLVRANKGQLMEVFLNILKNARDALMGKGVISISTFATNSNAKVYAVVEIRDTGPGIPHDIKERIFDPFFTTKEKGGGLNIGLGLSIAQSIVHEHGGWMEAANAAGHGAVFSVYLPAVESGTMLN
ncbi:PAS domain S-box protein, partial [bacterium]